jgi:hypothetical protein
MSGTSRRNRSFPVVGMLAGLLLTAVVSGSANANFIGPYDVANWTAVQNYDATVNTTAAPTTIVLTGANDQDTTTGGPPDDLDFTIASVSGSVVQFDWTYTSTDIGNWDWSAFLLDGVEMVLADNAAQPAGGTFALPLLTGEVFGFRVHSEDRGYGAGVLTITNFTVSPEPGSGVLLLVGLIGLAASGSKRRAAALIERRA